MGLYVYVFFYARGEIGGEMKVCWRADLAVHYDPLRQKGTGGFPCLV